MILVFLGFSLLLPACLDDPPPGPDILQATLIYYSNLMENDKVLWEVDNEQVNTGQSYGEAEMGIKEVEGFGHQAQIAASTLESGQALDTVDYFLDPFRHYMISLIGNEEEPKIICDTMDTSYPTPGLIRMRFLQAAENMGAVDIYVGGGLPEHRRVSGIGYGQLSEYIEAAQEFFWASITVTPADIAPEDSTILSYTVNNNFTPNRTYFGIMNHTEVDPGSSFRMQVYDQPNY